MRKALRVLWLVFLSVFPISSLLEDVEMEEFSAEPRGRKKPNAPNGSPACETGRD